MGDIAPQNQNYSQNTYTPSDGSLTSSQSISNQPYSGQVSTVHDVTKNKTLEIVVIIVVLVLLVFLIIAIIHFTRKDDGTMKWNGSAWVGSFTFLTPGAPTGTTYNVYDFTNPAIVTDLIKNGDVSGWSTPPKVGDILGSPTGVSSSTKPLPSSFSKLIMNYNATGLDWVTYS